MPSSTRSHRPIVIKIGGSTLGDHDTSLSDCVALCREGRQVVIVHGGGAAVTDWQRRLGAETEWVDGLRVTTPQSLEVVVAVLSGLINKQLAQQLLTLGAPAIGLSGVDGAMLRSPVSDRLGLVGETPRCDPATLTRVLNAGMLPVVSPVGMAEDGSTMLNINADGAAGAVAAALTADDLLFLTDVSAVLDDHGTEIRCLSAAQQDDLTTAGAISGGMLPKLRAGREAQAAGVSVRIIDGRQAGAVRRAVGGAELGTALI